MTNAQLTPLLATFAGAAAVTFLVTPLVAAVARRLGVVDVPGGRRIHARPVPRVGGAAVFAGLAVGALVYGVSFGWEALQWVQNELLAFLLPCLLVLAVGLVDDVRGLSPSAKLLAEAVAATFLIQAGYVIDDIANPFGTPIALGLFAFPVTLLWFIVVTNAFNLIDGLDGLLPTVAITALLGCAAIAVHGDRPASAMFALALAGALVGFLRWNWHPARVFLGDSGSLVIGLSIAALTIKVSRNLPGQDNGSLALHAPLLLCALPLAETTLTLARRWVNGQPFFEGDKSHIHHVLLTKGLSVPRATASLAGISLLFAASAVLSRSWRKEVALAWFVALLVIAAGSLRWLGYIEVRVILDRLRSRFGRQHGLPRVIAVARASDRLREASTVAELRRAMEELVEAGTFTSLTLELTTGVDVPAINAVQVGTLPGPDVASASFSVPIEVLERPAARLTATRVLDPTSTSPSDADVHQYVILPLTRALSEVLGRESSVGPGR